MSAAHPTDSELAHKAFRKLLRVNKGNDMVAFDKAVAEMDQQKIRPSHSLHDWRSHLIIKVFHDSPDETAAEKIAHCLALSKPDICNGSNLMRLAVTFRKYDCIPVLHAHGMVLDMDEAMRDTVIAPALARGEWPHLDLIEPDYLECSDGLVNFGDHCAKHMLRRATYDAGNGFFQATHIERILALGEKYPQNLADLFRTAICRATFRTGNDPEAPLMATRAQCADGICAMLGSDILQEDDILQLANQPVFDFIGTCRAEHDRTVMDRLTPQAQASAKSGMRL